MLQLHTASPRSFYPFLRCLRSSGRGDMRNCWCGARSWRPPAHPLAKILADAATVWQPVSVTGWYGTPERRLEISSQTAVWFHSGQTPVSIRLVLLRDPRGGFDPTGALLCTDPAREPLQIIRWFIQRWPVEVTFREARDHLGIET